MLGTIEDLEREIEQFQNNVMASGELVSLLKLMLEQIKEQNEAFNQKSGTLINRIDNLPITIENVNATSNSRIKTEVSTELGRAVINFGNEQNRYLQGLEQTRQQIQNYIESMNLQEEAFNKRTENLLNKLDFLVDQIQIANAKANEELKVSIDKLFGKRNAEFIAEQDKYISSLKQTNSVIKSAEDKLNVAYREFVVTLEKMNISNLYEQNQQLKSELNRRTTVLMVISIICAILGIIGLFI